MLRRAIRFWVCLGFAIYILLMGGSVLLLFSTMLSRICQPAWPADYEPAIGKAREAFLRQSGLQADMDKAQSFAEEKARGKAYALLGKTLTDTAVTAGAVIYKREIVVKKVSDPLLPFHPEHGINVSPNAAFISTTWRF